MEKKILVNVGHNFRQSLKYNGLWLALKGMITGYPSFDTMYPGPWYRFKRGEQFDYTNARLRPVRFVKLEDGSWDPSAMVKPEGQPVQVGLEEWEGAVKLGDWWTFRIDWRKFHLYFRYRSWTKNIFFIAWD